MIQLPQQPESANVRVLAQRLREKFTNVTTTLTLTNPVLTAVDGSGLEMVFVDDVFRNPDAYTVEGNTITFDPALAGTEIVWVYYAYVAR